jgi:NAD(P)-dependent dehydrogenase (short-subunit alcohol dehydrogenase family)
MMCVVLGASSGLGRRVAERLASAGANLVLASSDRRDVEAEASDLSLRYGVRALAVCIDLAAVALDFDQLDSAIDELGSVAAVVVTAGEVSDRDSFPVGPVTAEALLRVNLLSILLFVEHLVPRMQADSVVVGIGSVAALRGRPKNIVYSASKRALASIFESLRAALSPRRIRVQFYCVGYLDTNMSFGRALPLPVASVDRLAARIVGNLSRRSGTFFHPRSWSGLRWVVQAIPAVLWHRLRA